MAPKGRSDQKSHFPAEQRQPGTKAGGNPHPEQQQGVGCPREKAGRYSGGAAARIPTEAPRVNTAILTPDQENQPATLLTQEEGEDPKHSR